MRDLGDNLDEVTQARVKPILLAQFDFDDGTIGMWTGFGVFEYDGITYHGGGDLIGISPIEETQELQAKGLVLSLNGISSDLVSIALDENVKNRAVRIYLAFIGDGTIIDPYTSFTITDPYTGNNILDPYATYSLLGAPYRIFSGLMDTFEITDNADNATIRLSVESILLKGQRAKVSRYTDEDQRKRFPTDMGLEFINILQDREVVW